MVSACVFCKKKTHLEKKNDNIHFVGPKDRDESTPLFLAKRVIPRTKGVMLFRLVELLYLFFD